MSGLTHSSSQIQNTVWGFPGGKNGLIEVNSLFNIWFYFVGGPGLEAGYCSGLFLSGLQFVIIARFQSVECFVVDRSQAGPRVVRQDETQFVARYLEAEIG